MKEPKPPKTVYRHIKTAIHINILAMLLLAPLLLTQLLWLIVVFEVLLLLLLIRAVIVDMTEYVVLEDHCANVHTGLFFQRNNRVPYTKMNSIDITNFFGFHDLEIDAGNDVSEVKFRWIQDAHMLKAALDKKLEVNNYYQNSSKKDSVQSEKIQPYDPSRQQYGQLSYLPQAQQSAQEHMARNLHELNQLAFLRSQGVITSQEFEVQKQKILNS